MLQVNDVTLVPIAFECDEVVTIRRCPATTFAHRHADEFWYIRREFYSWDAGLIGVSTQQAKELFDYGYESLYWDGDKWALHTPKQFGTPEAAYSEWHDKVKGDRPCN